MFLSVHSSLSKKKAKGIAKKMFIHCAFLFLYGSFHESYKQVGLIVDHQEDPVYALIHAENIW